MKKIEEGKKNSWKKERREKKIGIGIGLGYWEEGAGWFI